MRQGNCHDFDGICQGTRSALGSQLRVNIEIDFLPSVVDEMSQLCVKDAKKKFLKSVYLFFSYVGVWFKIITAAHNTLETIIQNVENDKSWLCISGRL